MEINTLNIRKRIPEPIKKCFRWLYRGWDIKIDEATMKDLEEYYNLKRKEINRLLKSAGHLDADIWWCLNPKTEEEIKKFYEYSPFYVFELVFWHGSRYQRKLRSKIIELGQGKILDYGGGIGDLCIGFAQKGFEVDYAELQGLKFEFAKWLFSKHNHNISVINLSQEKIFKKYNTILCIDVIEHVKQPEILLKNFVDHLEGSGRLIITALHPDVSEITPMHFEMEFNPEEYLNSLGMIKAQEPFLWIKK
jgi:2-polyprenyl-3-methyl-5-hydroxy-6-metoxy-1,4-benzoquinol methylase